MFFLVFLYQNLGVVQNLVLSTIPSGKKMSQVGHRPQIVVIFIIETITRISGLVLPWQF